MGTELESVEHIDDQYSLLTEHGVIVDTGAPVNLLPLSKRPDSPVVKDEDTSAEISNWGEENDFPQRIIEAVELSTELAPLLDWKARALQGRQLLPFQLTGWDPAKKQMIYEYVDDPEIIEFLTHRITQRYLREAATDFFYFWNVFPDLIKSVAGDKIAYIGTHDASWCRWSKQDKQGNFKKCYVSANWPAAKISDKDTLNFNVVDPYSATAVEDLKKNTDEKWNRFVYPISYPSPGKAFYQLAPWNGFITTHWAKIARSIPRSKERLQSRILSARYILQIPINYWPAVYKDWAKKTPGQQADIKKAKVRQINDDLTGSDNAGKTILTEVGYDDNGKEIPSWKIIPIESASKDSGELEDSREASEHLMRALGVDPTLVGDGPGKKMGGGSGSDKRVAFNIYVALQQPYRDVILEPFRFIAEYNGWADKYPGLTFRFVEIELETLDKSHSTSKETTN